MLLNLKHTGNIAGKDLYMYQTEEAIGRKRFSTFLNYAVRQQL